MKKKRNYKKKINKETYADDFLCIFFKKANLKKINSISNNNSNVFNYAPFD